MAEEREGAAPAVPAVTPSVYLAHVRVRHHELDPLGHVNNATYLHYLEQAAIDHAEAVGWGVARVRGMGYLFIARRHEIEYVRPAVMGDWLRVATWIVGAAGARVVRAYEIARVPADALAAGPPRDRLVPADSVPPAGELIVRARTEWAYIEEATGRPRRIPEEFKRLEVRG